MSWISFSLDLALALELVEQDCCSVVAALAGVSQQDVLVEAGLFVEPHIIERLT